MQVHHYKCDLKMNKYYNQIDEANTNRLKCLFKAIEIGDVGVVQAIVNDRVGVNPNDYSRRRGELSVFEHACACCKNIRIFDILLRAMEPNENVLNVQSKYSGETPLILAVKWNNKCKIIKYLIQKGADPRITDADGWNALNYASLSNYDVDRLKIVDVITNSLKEWKKRENNAAVKIQSLQRGRRDRERVKQRIRKTINYREK